MPISVSTLTEMDSRLRGNDGAYMSRPAPTAGVIPANRLTRGFSVLLVLASVILLSRT